MVDGVAWLIFIRSQSSRFPNKCYAPLHGKTIYEHLAYRSQELGIDPRAIYLCTSDSIYDRPLITMANSFCHSILVGPEKYPIVRITENWGKLIDFRYIVRICGDSPLYPFRLVQRAIETYDRFRPSAITNTRLRNFPAGMSIEVYNRAALKRYLEQNSQEKFREHMCTILKEESFLAQDTIDIRTKDSLDFFDHQRYTVDYREDIEKIETILEAGSHRLYDRRLNDICLT